MAETNRISAASVHALPVCRPVSMGTANPDKVFYVIWRDRNGSGFFSNLQHVLGHIRRAEQLRMIPVIDQRNFPTLYNEKSPIHGKTNPWEYYFEKPSAYELEEVYESAHVCFGEGDYDWAIGSFMSEHGFFEVYNRNIRLLPSVQEFISAAARGLDLAHTVGVHFRGHEQNRAPGHPFCPTTGQMFRCVDQILETKDMTDIFLSTEEQVYLDSFVSRYGARVKFTPRFRKQPGEDEFRIEPRQNHRHLLGLEILTDAWILSECAGLLHSSSNVSEFARFRRQDQFKFRWLVDNGVNSRFSIVARYLYRLKRRLPRGLGGLPYNVRTF